MKLTETYRKQHNELLEMAIELGKFLNQESIEKNSEEIVRQLSIFSGKLNIHLTMEDKALYPKLISSKDEKIAKTAKEFMTEMGGIKFVVEKYILDWSIPKSLTANPTKFIVDTKSILIALKSRIEKENSTLYPLADSL